MTKIQSRAQASPRISHKAISRPKPQAKPEGTAARKLVVEHKQDSFSRPRPAAQAISSRPLASLSRSLGVPQSRPSGHTHTVRSGETLLGIAQRNGTDWQTLAEANGIRNPSLLFPGQKLHIPGAQAASEAPVPGALAPESPAPTAPVASSPPQPATSHTVRYGETLSSIAAQHGTTWQALAEANGIANPSRIFPGQVLQIPSPSGSPSAPAPTPAPTTPAPAAPTGPGSVDGVAGVPGDGSPSGALAWAQDQLPGGAQDGVNSNNNQSLQDSPKAWNNWCLAFVSTAFGRKVPELAAGSAIEAYNKTEEAGKINTSRDLPAGAPVFFGATSANGNFGHIAVATGRTNAEGDPILISSGWPGRDGIFEITLSELEQLSGPYLGYGMVG